VAVETVVVAADPAVVPLSCNRTHAFAMSNRLSFLLRMARLWITAVFLVTTKLVTHSFLRTLVTAQLLGRFTPFIEPEGSLPYSQEPLIRPCFLLDGPSENPAILLYTILTLCSQFRLVFL